MESKLSNQRLSAREILGYINKDREPKKKYQHLYEVGDLECVTASFAIGRERFGISAEDPRPFSQLNASEDFRNFFESQRTMVLASRQRSKRGLAGALIRQNKLPLVCIDNGHISSPKTPVIELNNKLSYLDGFKLSRRSLQKVLQQNESISAEVNLNNDTQLTPTIPDFVGEPKTPAEAVVYNTARISVERKRRHHRWWKRITDKLPDLFNPKRLASSFANLL